ncbi:hypothetical protein LEP1GSC088_0649 [Leptospira interrogans str. L1207]|nr:hypothetical protein LEP1GSC088_0649 [Leptospira interrogans str. L1207]
MRLGGRFLKGELEFYLLEMKSFYLPRFQKRNSLKIEFLFWSPLCLNIFIV